MSTMQKWINAGPDDGALHALLARVAERVPPSLMDALWIFPTRMAAGAESTVIVVASFDETDPERRTIATAHFRVTRDKRGKATVAFTMQEHGSAPVGATQRVVDGVLRRLGDEVGKEAPRHVELDGAESAWRELIVESGGEAGDEEDDSRIAERTAEDLAADDVAEGTVDDGTETPPHGDPLEEPVERTPETD